MPHLVYRCIDCVRLWSPHQADVQRSRGCFKENSSLHISSAKFMNVLIYPKNSIYPAKFPNDLYQSFSPYECQLLVRPLEHTDHYSAQTAILHYSVIIVHFVHHCTLKQALHRCGCTQTNEMQDRIFLRSVDGVEQTQQRGIVRHVTYRATRRNQ